MGRIALCALVFLFAVAGTRPGSAHPHIWIDMQVELLFDADGLVTGLRQTWLADELYTAFATEGLDSDGDGKPDPAALNDLLAENLKNLKDYGYFTKVEGPRGPIATGDVETYSSTMRGRQLEMTFVLPLVAPHDPRAETLRYAIYDPTYFISMLHAERDGAIRLTEAPDDCRFRVGKPPATAYEIAMAAAVDRGGQLPQGMGEIFAETVTVACGAR